MTPRGIGAVLVLVLATACGAGPAATDDGVRDEVLTEAGDPGPGDAATDATGATDATDDDARTDPGTDSVDARDDDGPLPPPPGGCRPCDDPTDCGPGLQCLPVGATKHCLSPCTDDGDCPGSYICYAASTAAKACLPVSYSCVACASEVPCSDGRVCDFVSGNCDLPAPLCGPCTYDFDCATGSRCLKADGNPWGSCVPECSDAKPCPDDGNFTCGKTAKGVRLCLPKVPGQCGGCPPERPFPAGDGAACWECLNDTHCDASLAEICDPETHACVPDPDGCGPGLARCDDGLCKQCCQDQDCPPGEGPCTNGYCVTVCDCCGGSCADPFPVCAVLDNVPQCVQCATDADCANLDLACRCSGSPNFACLLPDGGVCAPLSCGARCTVDDDCPAAADGTVLQCSVPGGGVCFDARGWCDSMSSCCGPGQACHSMGILTSMLPGPIPGFPSAACTCDELHPCLGGGTCHATADLCALPLLADVLCPGGTPPASMPAHLCTDLAELLTGWPAARVPGGK